MIERLKKCDWIDINTGVTWFGIKGKIAGRWYHLCESGDALVYGSVNERNDKLQKLKRKLQKKDALDCD